MVILFQDAKDLLVEYSFELIGGIVLGKAIGSLDHSWRPIIKTNKMTTLMVDNSYGQVCRSRKQLSMFLYNTCIHETLLHPRL